MALETSGPALPPEPDPLAETAPPAEARPAGARPAVLDQPADGPLLPDSDELRMNWQRVQASFVDDPRAAVTDAADLVEHAAQALAGALRQRQMRLRELWGGDGAEPDTERLRITLQHYRALFDQICRG